MCVCFRTRQRIRIVCFACGCLNVGFVGALCNIDYNECASQPCGNGATCVNGVAQFTCQCPIGWQGLTCTTDFNECASNPCQNGGTCTNGNALTHAHLLAYFSCNVLCCFVVWCVCVNTLGVGTGVYSCQCAWPYAGPNCTADFNECNSNPCMVQSSSTVLRVRAL